MTPLEKAKELFKKYFRDSDLLVKDLTWIQAKERALIAVDEILNNDGFTQFDDYLTEYWQQVKQEIKKIMSNKQQTAVDWLIEKFNQCEPMYSGIQSNEHKEYLDKLVQQAKEMEKEQIEDAYKADLYPCSDEDAEQYYKENYEQ
tara:strand:+ start:35 stop:469 length:435 start_codon:yes stop_codon:yes gene_type:complete